MGADYRLNPKMILYSALKLSEDSLRNETDTLSIGLVFRPNHFFSIDGELYTKEIKKANEEDDDQGAKASLTFKF